MKKIAVVILIVALLLCSGCAPADIYGDSLIDPNDSVPEIVVPQYQNPANTFTPTTEAEETFRSAISAFDGVSVHYKDIRSGYSFSYNTDVGYKGAGLMNIAYSMFVLSLVDSGTVKIDEALQLQENQYVESNYDAAPKITEKDIGLQFTLNNLLTHSIKRGDLTALKMMVDRFGIEEFKEYSKNLGVVNSDAIGDVLNGTIYPEDMSKYLDAAYSYMNDGHYAESFNNNLITPEKLNLITARDATRVAQWCGWDEGVLHSAAIVLSTRPYVLVVMSNHGAAESDIVMYNSISQAAEDFSKS